ncbi:hypothetical protein, partial [Escherichia coli]|uniref:hypothetical protein n=1 Tax=Escherichia coli TaxID=562 RepID=UPI001BDB74DA
MSGNIGANPVSGWEKHVSVSIRSQLSAKFHIWLSTLSLWGYSGEGKHKVWLHGVTAPDRGASFIW